MIEMAAQTWEAKRTDESRMVEDALRRGGFAQADAYRYNLASIRVRVIDSRFEGLSFNQRVTMIEPCLEQLPDRTYGDIITLFLFTPADIAQSRETAWEFATNGEFEEASPPMP